MTDKKKKYLAPEMNVIEVKAADIIATSAQGQTDPLSEEDFTTW